MTKCLVCGKENIGVICESCKENMSLEELCNEIAQYRVGSGEKPLWEEIAKSLNNSYHFKNAALAVADEIPSPRKEYVKILCLDGGKNYLPKDQLQWLYDVSAQILPCDGLSDDEKNRIRGFVMAGYITDYRYQECEDVANELLTYEMLPKWTYYTLIDFYKKTRRYERAEELIQKATKLYESDLLACDKIKELAEDNTKRRNGEKTEYKPQTKEGQSAYNAFMNTLGIDVKMPITEGGRPKPVPDDEYPQPIEIREADFDTFVAFDFETTGTNTKIDEIIEVGAIKVINGEIKEEKEFVFQKFIKPDKKRISEDITKLTGITANDVKDAKKMWDVIPEFLEFVGDNILVGYNSIAFDSKFLRRAGRYSHIEIKNKHFDVLRYARQYEKMLDVGSNELTKVAERLGIENPNAHRALSDAITTAKVFLRLKTLMKKDVNNTLDDILDDMDNW